LIAHVSAHPEDAPAIAWTLNIDATPFYAIEPDGPFAFAGYERLRSALAGQIEGKTDRISLAGRIAGSVALLNGQVVPVVRLENRGMRTWTIPDTRTSFWTRVFHELRNAGVTPQDRALNFAATFAATHDDATRQMFRAAIEAGLQLDHVDVERSPWGRPASDCWDVKFTFFDPLRRLESARQVYRWTIDVSDIVPITLGPLRSWYVY